MANYAFRAKIVENFLCNFHKKHGAPICRVSNLLYKRIPDLTGFSPEGLIGRTVLARKAVVWSRRSSDSGKEESRQSPIQPERKSNFE